MTISKLKEYILNPANKLFLREDVTNKDEYSHVVGDSFDPFFGKTLEKRVSIPLFTTSLPLILQRRNQGLPTRRSEL